MTDESFVQPRPANGTRRRSPNSNSPWARPAVSRCGSKWAATADLAAPSAA